MMVETPWTNRTLALFADRFGDIGEGFEGVDVAELDLYGDWMAPRGFAPTSWFPCGRTIVAWER